MPPSAAALNRVFHNFVSGTSQITSRRIAANFIEALCSQQDKVACIEKIITGANGLALLQNALRVDTSADFLNGSAKDLLKYLQDPSLGVMSGGNFLDQVVERIAESSTFWNPFSEAYKSGILASEAAQCYAWLLSRLVSLPKEKGSKYYGLARDILDSLLNSSDMAIRNVGAKIQHVLSTVAVPQHMTKNQDISPGGRHDNDHADFRKISILPTFDELLSKETPFYRLAEDIEDPSFGNDIRPAIYLDNQFRLLREDMMEEMRPDIQIALGKKKGSPRLMVVNGFSVVKSIFTGDADKRQPWGIQIQCHKDFPQLQKVKPDDRKNYFEKNRNFIKHQCICCLIVDNEVVALPSIHRDEDLLKAFPPQLILQLQGRPMVEKTLLKLKTGAENTFRLVQLDTPLFAYEPVLKGLQGMKEIPLVEEILFWDNNSQIRPSPSVQCNEIQAFRENPKMDLKCLLDLQSSVYLDDSQAESFIASITQSLSLIQGPPGTGKSFIGALIAKFLYKYTTKKVLVVCYTNHALDQFLEDLMKHGIPKETMVRIGGKANTNIAPLSLFHQSPSRSMVANSFQYRNRIRNKAKEKMEELKEAYLSYLQHGVTKTEILDHIAFLDSGPQFWEAFQVPQNDSNFEIAGKGGKQKAIDGYYLLNRWIDGKDPSPFSNQQLSDVWTAEVWEMPPQARKLEIVKWHEAILRDRIDTICCAAEAYEETCQELNRMSAERDSAILKERRIIGVTTTGAAKYAQQIRDAAAEILLVEEAGEIMESHILTSLNSSTNQIILIGDHKQLRPKIASYPLSVESGKGFDLNRSLFERLVIKGYPHQTLTKQHRMRPEISRLVRELTYPDLLDDPKTLSRTKIRGLQQNVIFVNHSHEEVNNSKIGDVRDMGAKTSKQNIFEVNMVLKIVKYLAQQGYKTENMVVLTPYLGQLSLLRQALSKDTDPVLSDIDSHELIRAGLMSSNAGKLTKKRIHLATIDNYQGEESDIVICSLTRGNAARDIGFMNAPERLNVLLSRARDGLILIGNAATFQNAKGTKGRKLWGTFFEMIKENLFDGIPVHCERHPDRKNLLTAPGDFDEQCPDGGCQELCGATLSCKHQCPRRCHREPDHSKMECEHILEQKCVRGVHQIKYMCHRGPPASCKTCEREDEKEKKRKEKELKEQKRRDREQEEYTKLMDNLEEQLNNKMEEHKENVLKMEREQVRLRKKHEIEQVEQRNRETILRTRNLANSRVPPTPSSSSQPTSVANSSVNSTGIFARAQVDTRPSASSIPRKTDGQDLPTSTTQKVVNSSPPSSLPKSTSTACPTPGSASTVPCVDSSSEPQGMLILPPPPRAPPEPKYFDPLPPSPSKQEWERQKQVENALCTPIDALMDMTGLESIKAQVLAIKAKIDTAKRQGTDLKDERFHINFQGNPGTGKTTVARHYAKFLNAVGALPGSNFKETTGSKLAHGGVGAMKELFEGILKEGGGTLFIDEAYQLTEEHNTGGKQVLDWLLAEMENKVGQIVVIIAGYTREMEKFFKHNSGLPSRFPYALNFEDYQDNELHLILKECIRKKFKGQMQVEDGLDGLYMRIAIRRLGRARGNPGFGNARAVQNFFAKVRERQAKRLETERKISLPNDFFFSKEDLIGPEPSKALVQSKAWKKLQSMIGLQEVKNSVKSLFDRIETNYQLELIEKKTLQVSLNKVFLGSPGTGKTTVAKLYGQILVDLGLLSSGEVLTKNPSDFVGNVIGGSEANTKGILAAALGKVLIIDEVYMLYQGRDGAGNQNDPFRTAVVDTLVAEVQSTPGEDRCVLLLGYEDKIEEMFQNVNPGLSRRFPLSDAFRFEDFTADELRMILNMKLKDQDLDATPPAKDVVIEKLERMRNKPNFGNAGEVENLLSEAKNRYQSRIAKNPPPAGSSAEVIFEPEDFDPEYNRASRAATNLQELFSDVIGCEDIVKKLRGYQKTAEGLKAQGLDPRGVIPTNFLFKGPPGTGKTTTARKIGQVYYDMGFLSSAEVIDCSASDLIGQYIGHTGPKTTKQLEKGLGKVLLIDEAYRLADGKGSFASEAVNELVDLLTKPKFAGKLIVCLAGYEDDINRLMSINPGLSSRFPEEIIFKPLTPEHSLQILNLELNKKKVLLAELSDESSTGYKRMFELVQDLSALPQWGNARDIQTLSKKMVSYVFEHLVDTGKMEITSGEAITFTEEMLRDRTNRAQNSVVRGYDSPNGCPSLIAPLASSPPAPPPPPLQMSTAKVTSQVKQPTMEELESDSDTYDTPDEDDENPEALEIATSPSAAAGGLGCDPGVSEATRRTLQLSIATEKAALEAADRAREELRRAKEEEERQEKLRKDMEARLQAAKAEEERRKIQELLERQRRIEEEARRRAEEARRKKEEEQERKRKLEEEKKKVMEIANRLGRCVAGFEWFKVGGGYRCRGGSHFMSDAELRPHLN